MKNPTPLSDFLNGGSIAGLLLQDDTEDGFDTQANGFSDEEDESYDEPDLLPESKLIQTAESMSIKNQIIDNKMVLLLKKKTYQENIETVLGVTWEKFCFHCDNGLNGGDANEDDITSMYKDVEEKAIGAIQLVRLHEIMLQDQTPDISCRDKLLNILPSLAVEMINENTLALHRLLKLAIVDLAKAVESNMKTVALKNTFQGVEFTTTEWGTKLLTADYLQNIKNDTQLCMLVLKNTNRYPFTDLTLDIYKERKTAAMQFLDHHFGSTIVLHKNLITDDIYKMDIMEKLSSQNMDGNLSQDAFAKMYEEKKGEERITLRKDQLTYLVNYGDYVYLDELQNCVEFNLKTNVALTKDDIEIRLANAKYGQKHAVISEFLENFPKMYHIIMETVKPFLNKIAQKELDELLQQDGETDPYYSTFINNGNFFNREMYVDVRHLWMEKGEGGFSTNFAVQHPSSLKIRSRF